MKRSRSNTRLSPRHLTGMLAAIQATAVVGAAIGSDGPHALVVVVLGSLLASLATGVAAAAFCSARVGLVIPDGFSPVSGRWFGYLVTGITLLLWLAILGAGGDLRLIGGSFFLWSILMSEALAVEWLVDRERGPR